MPRNYDAIDFDFSVTKGDYLPSPMGDILDTSEDQIEALRQRVGDLIRSSLGDWEFRPEAGADLDGFIGRANTRGTAELLQKRVSSVLVTHALVRSEDLSVKIVPLDRETVMIMIAIQAMPTRDNTLASTTLRFDFLFGFENMGVKF